MVNMRPEQALFFAIYIAGLSSARPFANQYGSETSTNVGGPAQQSSYAQYKSAALGKPTPSKTAAYSPAGPTKSIDLSNIEADVSKVLAVATPYLHATSLPQIPTFLGLPAAKASECASKVVAVAEPSITSNPLLMDAAVAGAMGVADKYLSTTTDSAGSTLIGFPASDLPKYASEVMSMMPSGVKNAASSVMANIPSGVQSAAQNLESLLPSGIQGDINSLLGGAHAAATPTPSATPSYGAASSAVTSVPDLSAYPSKRDLFGDLSSKFLGKTSSTSSSSSSTITAKPSSSDAALAAFSSQMAAQQSSEAAAIATMSIECTGVIGC